VNKAQRTVSLSDAPKKTPLFLKQVRGLEPTKGEIKRGNSAEKRQGEKNGGLFAVIHRKVKGKRKSHQAVGEGKNQRREEGRR